MAFFFVALLATFCWPLGEFSSAFVHEPLLAPGRRRVSVSYLQCWQALDLENWQKMASACLGPIAEIVASNFQLLDSIRLMHVDFCQLRSCKPFHKDASVKHPTVNGFCGALICFIFVQVCKHSGHATEKMDAMKRTWAVSM